MANETRVAASGHDAECEIASGAVGFDGVACLCASRAKASAASVPECPACRPVDDHPQAALQCTRDEGCILKEALAAAPVAALTRDLKAVRRWVEVNTYCAIQQRDGWYVKDCIESKARRKCERCKMIARLDKHLVVSRV